MNKDEREKLEAHILRQKDIYESSGLGRRLFLNLKSVIVAIDLAIPMLVPILIGVSMFLFSMIVGGLLVPPEYGTWLLWISLGIATLSMLPKLIRNLKFQEFAEDSFNQEKKQ